MPKKKKFRAITFKIQEVEAKIQIERDRVYGEKREQNWDCLQNHPCKLLNLNLLQNL